MEKIFLISFFNCQENVTLKIEFFLTFKNLYTAPNQSFLVKLLTSNVWFHIILHEVISVMKVSRNINNSSILNLKVQHRMSQNRV